MWYIFVFINKSYWKSILSPVMSFIFPILYVAIIGGVYSILGQLNPTVILPEAWSIGIMITTLLCLPQMIHEMRHSIMMKRLGISKYKPWMFYSILVLFFLVINFVSYLCLIATSYLVLINNVSFLNDLLIHASAWEVVYALFMTFVMSLSIGLFLASVCKTPMQIWISGIIILLVSMLLSGMIVPIVLVYPNITYRIFTLISPYSYTNSMLTESWFWGQMQYNTLSSSIFQPGTEHLSAIAYSFGRPSVILQSWQKWMNLIVPPLITIVFMFVSLIRLKFNYK